MSLYVTTPWVWGVHKCAWIGVGTVGMCTVCHAMSYGNFWNISHVDCAKILNENILDGMVLGDSDREMRGKLEQKS